MARYQAMLNGWSRRIAIDQVTQEYELTIVCPVFRDWPAWKKPTARLISTAAVALSPAARLTQYPLKRLEDAEREWLAGVVNALWVSRYSIDDRVARCSSALEAATSVYVELDRLISTPPAQRQPGYGSLVESFSAACQELAASIGELGQARAG